jgi:hypothetical protein
MDRNVRKNTDHLNRFFGRLLSNVFGRLLFNYEVELRNRDLQIAAHDQLPSP